MRFIVMFVTTVCVLFLIKLQWPKRKNFYDKNSPCFLSACGGTLSGSSGSFASPGYPGFYSNNLNCLWTLFIPANGVLRLQLIVFETESW